MIHLQEEKHTGKFAMPEEVAEMESDEEVIVCGHCLRLIVEDFNKYVERYDKVVKDYNRAAHVINTIRLGLDRGIDLMKNGENKMSRKVILKNLENLFDITEAPDHLEDAIRLEGLDNILDMLRRIV